MCEVMAAGAVRTLPPATCAPTHGSAQGPDQYPAVWLATITNHRVLLPSMGRSVGPQASLRLLSAQLPLDPGLQGGSIRSATRPCFSAAAAAAAPRPPTPRRSPPQSTMTRGG